MLKYYGKRPQEEGDLEMGLPDYHNRDQEVQRFIQDITEIFFSEEFNSLRQELETVYFNCNMENAFLTAFQDALFTILTQNSSVLASPRGLGK